jgi:hypothetical protein
MRVLGIDPGPEHSAYVLWESGSVRDAAFIDNEALRHYLRSIEVHESDQCAIETITGYGMPVGKETFGTCIWIGIFQECWSRRSEHRAIPGSPQGNQASSLPFVAGERWQRAASPLRQIWTSWDEETSWGNLRTQRSFVGSIRGCYLRDGTGN